MNHLVRLAAPSLVAAAALLAAPPARAGLESCGNIDVRANATCEVVAKGGCTAKCEPVSLQAACSAKLAARCDGECKVAADVACTASCTTDCAGRCKVDPGKLDCAADCRGSCTADCSGKCASSGTKAECEASCRGSCGAKCDARCSATPPSATCEAKCEASCGGSCEARANVDCQVRCQSNLMTSCTADLKGGCAAQCEKPDGALFCDGQYVDTGDNLARCVDALKAALNVKVEASGSSQCTGNECSAEGQAKVSSSCAAAPGERALSPAWGLGLLGFVAAGAARRRRGTGRVARR